MKLELKIESDNAAFQDGNARAETARILRDAADKIENETCLNRGLYDFNGNKVGTFTAKE